MGPVRDRRVGRTWGRRGRTRRRPVATRLWSLALLTALLTALPVGLVTAGPGDEQREVGGSAALSKGDEQSTTAQPPAPEPAPPPEPEEAPAGTEEPLPVAEEATQAEPGDGQGETEASSAAQGGGAGGEAESRTEAESHPPGNNGTVKIDGIPFDDHPDNEPHVGCVFQIDFYGYDEGDLHATYRLDLQAPTGSGTIASGSVFIGEDAAGGATDLDASVTVDLTEALASSGATSHPQQGYHIKLTVHAEGSIGADVKHKVFWVKCDVGGDVEKPLPQVTLEVVKLWVDQAGEKVDAPADLSEAFRIILTKEADGSLTCVVVKGSELQCEGDLDAQHGDVLTVTEENAPGGWIGPDTAVVECDGKDGEDGKDKGKDKGKGGGSAGTRVIAPAPAHVLAHPQRVCTVTIVNQAVEEVEAEQIIKVVKLWVDQAGEKVDAPADLSEAFRIILTKEGDGSLTCVVVKGSELQCEGDLDAQHGDVLTVTEENAPGGWIGPDTAVVECDGKDGEDGKDKGKDKGKGGGSAGTRVIAPAPAHVLAHPQRVCTVTIVNQAVEEVEAEQIIKVVKSWIGAGGEETTTPPADLSKAFEIEIRGVEGSLTCSYAGNDLKCSGDLVVQDGEEVTVIERDLPEGWTGPDTATAECETEESKGGTRTVCTIALVNLFEEVAGEVLVREVVKVWVDETGASTVPPADLPSSFRLILSGDGTLTCLYQGTALRCAGDLALGDGAVVTVTEVDAPEGWVGPGTAVVECETVEDTTTCTITVENVFEAVAGVVVTRPAAPAAVAGVVAAAPLAITGLEALYLVAAALLLLALGGALVHLSRRRREA